MKTLTEIELELSTSQDLYNGENPDNCDVKKREDQYKELEILKTSYDLLLEGTKKQFCSDFSQAFKCTPEEVRRELDRQDPIFTKLFKVYRLGQDSK